MRAVDFKQIQQRISNALFQDPKKSGVLGVLILMLLVLAGRAITGSAHPAAASGATFNPYPASAVAPESSAHSKAAASASLVRNWLQQPIPALIRNDFLLRSQKTLTDATAIDPAAAVKKSPADRADLSEKRSAWIAALKQQAACLRPTSIVVGASPRAIVKGTLVRVGDVIDGFCVTGIEPHAIVVQCEDVRLAIPMN